MGATIVFLGLVVRFVLPDSASTIVWSKEYCFTPFTLDFYQIDYDCTPPAIPLPIANRDVGNGLMYQSFCCSPMFIVKGCIISNLDA
jgi:hypothetical protein